MNGTEATYICASGESDAVNIRTCDCNGNWSEPVPTCTGNDCVLKVFCVIILHVATA